VHFFGYLNIFAICNCYSDTTVAVFSHSSLFLQYYAKKFTYDWRCLRVWQAS